MSYIKKISKEPIFKQDGLDGYGYNLSNKNVELYIEDVYKGHERYTKSLTSTYIYYVLEGEGTFKVEEETFDVVKDDVIEIEPNKEFVFTGKMKLLVILNPPYNEAGEIPGKLNDLY